MLSFPKLICQVKSLAYNYNFMGFSLTKITNINTYVYRVLIPNAANINNNSKLHSTQFETVLCEQRTYVFPWTL